MCASAADDVEKAQANVVNAVFAVQHGRYRHGRVDTAEQALADVADRHGYGIESRTLALDDASAGLTHILLNLVQHKQPQMPKMQNVFGSY